MSGPRPPALFRALLRAAAPEDLRDAVSADLDEEYEVHVLPKRGPAGARRWYRGQVVRSLVPLLSERLGGLIAGGGVRSGLVQDVRFALRALVKRPEQAAITVAVLGLGIGGATLAFSVVEGVVLRPFPYPEPDRLIAVGVVDQQVGGEISFMENVSPPEYIDVRERTRTLERLYAFDRVPTEIRTRNGTVAVDRNLGWGDAFRTLDVQPHLGRGFRPDEMEPAGQPVAVLSHRLWVDGFGADPDILGQPVDIGRAPYTVVGVIPPGILFAGADVWTPAGSPPATRPRGPRRLFQVVGRMHPEVGFADVEAELDAISAAIAAEHLAEHPEYERWSLVPATWAEANVRAYGAVGVFVFVGTLFVLLLVCVNIAGLNVARSTGRVRELAIRKSLGAGDLRIARLLLIESLVAGLAGGALGIAVAVVGAGVVNDLLASMADVHGTVTTSSRVLVFGVAGAVVTGLATGLIPAWQLARREVEGVLRAGAPSATAERGPLRAQQGLVLVEVTVALLILAGTWAVGNAFLGLSRTELGYQPERLLSTRIDLPPFDYPTAREASVFYLELTRRLDELPGVERSAASFRTPANPLGARDVRVEGGGADRVVSALVTYATPSYLSVLGLSHYRGRTLTGEDQESGAPVALVNEAFVTAMSSGDPVLGYRLTDLAESEAPPLEIVGVVPSIRNRGPAEPSAPEVFTPLPRDGSRKGKLFVIARVSGGVPEIIPSVRATLGDLDPWLPLLEVESVEEGLGRSLAALRIGTWVFLGFAVISLVLAALGIGAVVWLAASKRSREIGLRRVLGAQDASLRRTFAGITGRPAALGAGLGLVLAATGGPRMLVYVPGVAPPSLLMLGTVAATLVAVAWLAAFLPARSATRVDPAEILRAD